MKNVGDEEFLRLSKNMRRWREDVGATVHEVSRQTCVPVEVIVQLEENRVTDDVLIDQFLTLCTFYGKRPAEFFE